MIGEINKFLGGGTGTRQMMEYTYTYISLPQLRYISGASRIWRETLTTIAITATIIAAQFVDISSPTIGGGGFLEGRTDLQEDENGRVGNLRPRNATCGMRVGGGKMKVMLCFHRPGAEFEYHCVGK